MKAIWQIYVKEILSETLNTRESASTLIKLIRSNPCKLIELDFTDVEFMSRSFADQFHKEKSEIKESNIEIINAHEEIVKILNVVAKTQNSTKREYVHHQVYRLSNRRILSDYLAAI